MHRRKATHRALVITIAVLLAATGAARLGASTRTEGGASIGVVTRTSSEAVTAQDGEHGRAMGLDFDLPGDDAGFGMVTFSAECRHNGGERASYTWVSAFLVTHIPSEGGTRRVTVRLDPKSGRDLVFCQAPDGVSASHTWTGALPGRPSYVRIRFGSVGGGIATLDDMTLVVQMHAER